MRNHMLSALLILSVMLFALPVPAHQDTKKLPVCSYCNMDREAFAHARVQIDYTDGASTGACSIHCAAIDLIDNRAKIPCRIQVGDYGSRKLIDATTAYWVIGGDKPGVMTDRAKWAFENKADAEAFVKKHGGKRATFYQALQAAYDGLFEDMKITLERVKERKAKGWDMCEQAGK